MPTPTASEQTIPLLFRPTKHQPSPSSANTNPLPKLIQTPSGLALLELQGEINIPAQALNDDDNDDDGDGDDDGDEGGSKAVHLGRITFPDYDPESVLGGTGWMKRVYMFIGDSQRLAGEVKKLPRPVGVVTRRAARGRGGGGGGGEEEQEVEELEIVEIVKYKLVFTIRPEPVGN